ncbi:hypothetical protein JVU11DRAFT_1529 [Chiua virens]|nr:hypothetical protein JVU11DRAFT_1529 [Chiua virens]
MQVAVDSSHYCPTSLESPLATSLDHATSTIDDLTLALTNFSRVPSPEPQQICCCCGNEDCEATKTWLGVKSKLESRLILSAEIGSALLQRHEAYVRRHEPSNCTLRKATQDSAADVETGRAEVEARVAELLKENATLEKVAEASNKTILHDLEEARSTVSRLNAHHARTVGLDTRLSAVLQENDDIRQERDSQTQRAKLAEARLAALKNRTDKLQTEVRRLQDALEIGRLQRIESSDSLLQDVRSRLQGLQISHVAKSAAEENPEVINVIESLVADNEMLKSDNMELQKLLTESREDLQALQTEVGEQNIAPPVRVETPSQHSQGSNGSYSFVKDSLLDSKRPSSVESRSRRVFEPLTPETSRRPLSPTESSLASATKCINSVHHHSRYPPSHQRKPYKPTGSLGLHGGVYQVTTSSTDQSSTSPHDGHSDSSSLLDGFGSPMSSILERMHSLLHRMTQADALTLTNRLKRQHLRGADVKHLSRTTVSNILSDISHLRARYRVWLEDEKLTTLCTRKDLRGLFKLFKEVLEEMGQMRVTLNDIILEPNVAVKVSEMALDPAKAEAMDKEAKVNGIGIGASWMAPFSKLFGSSAHDVSSLPSITRTLPRPINGGDGNIRVSRPVPKIGPALAASATTVNVEFSGTGAGKSVTNVFSAHPDNEGSRGHGHLSSL